MSLVEFTSETPIFRRALDDAPDTRVTVIDDRMPPDGPLKLIFRATGSNLDAFETGLDADPTIAAVRVLDGGDESNEGDEDDGNDEEDDIRLFRVSYTQEGMEQSITTVITETDATLSAAVVTHGTVWFRLWIPDRNALQAIRAWSVERGRSFTVEKLYNAEPQRTENQYSLTDAQLEAVQCCFESGYFEVPRRATCADVAAELGISSQSLSERIRRGVGTIVAESGVMARPDASPSRASPAERKS